MDRPVLVIDAFNLFTRHFIAHPGMAENGERAGEPAGGIAGFINSTRWLVDTLHPDKVVVVWESGGSHRKRKLFSEYKMHRRPQKLNRYYEDDIPTTTENRNWQVSTIVSLLREVGVCQVYVPDCEADDVIGYICKYKFKGKQKVIVSSDKDFYQLLGDDTKVYNPMGKRYVEASDVLERFGISSQNFCVAKALCGDPSDNIPGVKGVGFKTLAKRFPLMGTDTEISCSDIITEAREKAQEKRAPQLFGNIAGAEELIKLNWQLMYLDTNNLAAAQIKKIDHTLDSFDPHHDKMSLMRKLIKAGLPRIDADRLAMVCRSNLKN